MSRVRRKTPGEPAGGKASTPRSQGSAAVAVGPDVSEIIGAVFVLALVVVRWLVPAESAHEGDTLWIVQLWFASLAIWVWSRFRTKNWSVRLNLFDAALWTVIAGHVLATAFVFWHGGNRRAAIDLSWEWVGLGVTYFLLRQFVPGIAGGSPGRLATVAATLGIVLAGLGIWQHYVYYPRAYEEYHSLQTELEQLREHPAENAARIGKIELKLQANGVPSDKAAQRQFENRLRFSNEPFGPFALANTFAGFLLVAAILCGDLFRGAKRPFTATSVAIWAAAFLLLVYCLVLTKSRTAWIALVVALGFWGICSLFSGRAIFSRGILFIAAAVLLAIGALFGIAALKGGFDVQVISEAPKSLDYRLQYWKGALGVIREHPIVGVGPGNFRQHYLHHKLAESSEEIADPHNFILDLWSSGGLLALAGCAGCLIFAVAPFLRRRNVEESPKKSSEAEADERRVWSTTVAGVAGGFLLAVIAPLLTFSGDFDFWTILLFAAWFAAFALISRQLSSGVLSGPSLSGAALGGAVVGLGVHLLGAGGIEMPAVVQMFLVIAALMFAIAPRGADSIQMPRFMVAAGVAAVALFVCCLLTATLPVFQRRERIAAGEQALALDGDVNRAVLEFGEAAVCDPFSPEPHEKLAEAFFSRWQAGRKEVSGSDDFDKCRDSLRMAIKLDPDNPSPYRRLGQMYAAKFARSQDPADAAAAADSLSDAVDRYPNDASLRAERATAFSDAGRTADAKKEAERALQLDEINRQNGHTDRYLSDATVLQLRRLAAGSAK
jgi:O-antigen ligase